MKLSMFRNVVLEMSKIITARPQKQSLNHVSALRNSRMTLASVLIPRCKNNCGTAGQKEFMGGVRNSSEKIRKTHSLDYFFLNISTRYPSDRENYSRNLLITGRSPPHVCKYSALNPSKENNNTGGFENLSKLEMRQLETST